MRSCYLQLHQQTENPASPKGPGQTVSAPIKCEPIIDVGPGGEGNHDLGLARDYFQGHVWRLVM